MLVRKASLISGEKQSLPLIHRVSIEARLQQHLLQTPPLNAARKLAAQYVRFLDITAISSKHARLLSLGLHRELMLIHVVR